MIDGNQFCFVEQRLTSYYIYITLKKFLVSALLRLVSPPNRLDLVSLEGKLDFILIHNYKPGKRNS